MSSENEKTPCAPCDGNGNIFTSYNDDGVTRYFKDKCACCDGTGYRKTPTTETPCLKTEQK